VGLGSVVALGDPQPVPEKETERVPTGSMNCSAQSIAEDIP